MYEPTAEDWDAYVADMAAHADDPRDAEARRIADLQALAELDAWVERQAMEMDRLGELPEAA